jgi:uncharacterized protein (TIGR03086 family)
VRSCSSSPEQLDLATPCAGWTVRDLLQHVVDSTLDFAAGARGSATGVDRPMLDDPLTAYRAAAQEVTEAFRAEGLLGRLVEFPGYGVQPGRSLVAAHFVDQLVHTWDLNKACGVDVHLDDDLAEAALAIAHRFPDDQGVRGPHSAFGEAIPGTGRRCRHRQAGGVPRPPSGLGRAGPHDVVTARKARSHHQTVRTCLSRR